MNLYFLPFRCEISKNALPLQIMQHSTSPLESAGERSFFSVSVVLTTPEIAKDARNKESETARNGWCTVAQIGGGCMPGSERRHKRCSPVAHRLGPSKEIHVDVS